MKNKTLPYLNLTSGVTSKTNIVFMKFFADDNTGSFTGWRAKWKAINS